MAEEKRTKGVPLSWLAAIPIVLAALFAGYPSIWQSSKSNVLPSVTIRQGTIVGRMVDDDFPEPLEGFMGIPYAIPPVGERRFLPAEPVPSSNGTHQAFYLGPR